MKIAVLADVHVHDVYGDYDFAGVLNSRTGLRATVRTLKDTVKLTRIFNESYFAFITALDDIVSRGIRHVVLVGDYSDDGQRTSVAGVVAILRRYTAEHGLSFYAATGNHDTARPFGGHHTKRFLKEDGSFVSVTSDPERKRNHPSQEMIVTDKMWGLGYDGNLSRMSGAGFMPDSTYLHWETPFGTDASLDHRMLDFATADGQGVVGVPDASYLVEPIDGLWILSLDTNVFLPKPNGDFHGSTDTGWNTTIAHKRKILDWARDVTARAKSSNKKLLVFSHYPAVDYTNGTHDDQHVLFGSQSFLKRNPEREASRAALEAGIAVHFSGHLHLDAVGRYNEGECTIVNVAVPSLAAYPAAYKVVSMGTSCMSIETVLLDEVPRFDELFEHYRNEPGSYGEILNAGSYREFLREHMSLLALHRHIPSDWSQGMQSLIARLNCLDLMRLANSPEATPEQIAAEWAASNHSVSDSAEGLASVSFQEMVIDWYRLRSGGSLAMRDIRPVALRCYGALFAAYSALLPQADSSVQGIVARFLRILTTYIDAAAPEELTFPLA